MGILVDPDEARRAPCRCYLVGEDPEQPEDRICFSRGIIGTLSDAQERAFCQEKPLVLPLSPAMQERMRRFRVLGRLLDTCMEQEEPDFRACLMRELERIPGGSGRAGT